MKIYRNSSISRYMLIMSMLVALLFAQAFKFHMHVQHDGSAPVVSSGYILDAHAAVSFHGTKFDPHQTDDLTGHHHTADVSVSVDSVVKQVKIFSLLILLLSIVSILWSAPCLLCARIERFAKTKLVPLYYLQQPPLRAPPR